ncbi:unnamed protein product [Xylocopa violacea]|uniref:Cupin-like domain-containing protein n=1 Tax=Xylocopa violacea TaxID=135666 RepID=A0ABP1NHA9_XYLVO
MTDLNSNKVSSDSPKKSLEFAKKELRAIVTRIEETSLLSRSAKLFRAQRLLGSGGSKLRRGHLWILLILAWILGQFLWNYVHTVRHDKVSYEAIFLDQGRTSASGRRSCVTIFLVATERDALVRVSPAFYKRSELVDRFLRRVVCFSSVWRSYPRSRRKYSGQPRTARCAGTFNRLTGYPTWILRLSSNGTDSCDSRRRLHAHSPRRSLICFATNSYAYSGRPVVVTDAMANWTATTKFSFAFFKSLYDGEDANCQFFPYKTEFKSLQDVFEMSESRASLEEGTKPWYVGWSNCDEEIGSELRRYYQRPYFLPATAESEKTDWIFMGSHGYGAPMHVDDVEHPSWQAQIKGEKQWILEPPRECHYACNRLEVVVHPGEIIVLDTNRWYHQTKIVSEEMSITIGAEYD